MINQQNFDLVGRAVAQSALTTEERQRQQMTAERLATLEKRRVTPDKQLSRMEFLFRLFDTPCFPRGELVAVTGKAKSGKTFVTSMLMALCASDRVLAFTREDAARNLRVLWLDTEQSEESTQDILRNRIIPMAGEEEQWYDIFNVRIDPWDRRLPLLEAAIGGYRPDLVILDGIRDLVSDINDGVMAQDVTERLMHLAQEHRCCIACVLHQNKASEDRNLRGWIGTELTNKAFEVYACEKYPDRTFTLEQTHTRKYDILDTMRYTVNAEGLPVLTGGSGNVSDGDGRHPMNPRYVIRSDNGEWSMNLQLLFADALKGGAAYSHRQLCDWMRERAGLNQIQYRAKLVSRAVAQGIIVKGQDMQGHVVYSLPGTGLQQPDLFSEAGEAAPF